MFGADCSALFVRMRQSRTIHSSAMDSMCNIGSVLPMTKSSARPSPDALRVILAVADVLTRWCGHIVPYESSSSDWPERTVPSSFVVRLLDQHEVYPTHPSDFMKVAKRQHLRHNRNTTCLEHCDISCSIFGGVSSVPACRDPRYGRYEPGCTWSRSPLHQGSRSMR